MSISIDKISGEIFLLDNQGGSSGTTSNKVIIAHQANSSYDTLQEFINACDSSGVISGLDIYDIGGGNVQITSGITLLRKTTSTFSTLEFINYSGGTIAIPPDGTLWYLGLSYNNGNPIIVLSPADAWNNTDQIQLGSAIVLPIGILVFRNQHTSNNLFSKITQRFEADGFAKRDEHVGGLMLGETGTRNVTLTSGTIWAKLNKFDISSIDTSPSGGDFLFNFYLSGTTSGGTWAINTNVQYDNLHYNDVTNPNGLVTMRDGYYCNLWFYISIDNGLIGYVYGQSEFPTQISAFNEEPPTLLPPGLSNIALLVGRFLIQKNGSSAISIDSPFIVNFNNKPIENASGITVTHILGSKYSSVQDFLTLTHSSGFINGGKISDNGNGTVNVTSGATLIRINSGSTSNLLFVNYTGETVAIPSDGALWYLGLEYNNGNPKIVLATNDNWNNANQIQVGNAIRLPIGTLVFTNQHTSSDITTKLIQRFESEGTANRDERIGGLILGETGTRNITLTSGTIWAKLNQYQISPINTSGSDFLFNFYYSGGTSTGATWIVGTDVQYDNLHYNDVTNQNGLVPLTNGYFTNLWFYLSIDSGLIGYVYGQNQYSGATLASLEGAPIFLPPGLSAIALLVGRVIIQKNGSSASSIDSVFKVSFNSSVASLHNNLSGLQGGSANEYYHLTNAKFNIVQNTSGINSGDETTSRINALYGYTPQSKEIFTGYTATTAPNQFVSITNFNTYTGTTEPTKYVKISNFNPYTASTLTDINSRLLKTDFNIYTGTSSPYVKISNFNPYSAFTLTNITSRLLTSIFNSYSGVTTTKIGTIESLYLTGATNGLSITQKKIKLGGNLTGATQIGLGTNSITFTGTTGTLKYGSDLSANYTLRSLVDKSFVTGITSTLLVTSAFNTYSATTLTNINSRVLKTDFNIYTGTTLTNIQNRLLTTSFNTYSGNTLNLINLKVSTVNNGLTKAGINVHLGGALTGATQIGLGTNSITFTGTTGTLKYGSDLSANYTLRSLVDKGFVTGITSTLLSISAFNTYSGVTLTNINSRLLTTAFNTYSGATLTLINAKISTANNGLTKSGTNIHLGGALTGATQIGLGTNSITFTGTTGTLKYGSDLSANYTLRSLVDKSFVTGITSTLIVTSAFNSYSASTLTNINSRLLTTAFNTYSGATLTLINIKIGSANNGLTKSGTNVHLGGALTGATQIGLGANSITFTGTTGTLKYGSDLSANYTLRSLVDKNFVTGITSTLLVTSAFNTYSGNTSNLINTKIGSANNGLTKSGTNVHLGGALTGATQIGLGTNSITFTGTTGTLKYGSDLSANYTLRSLVDKGFVTGITSTLQNRIIFQNSSTVINTGTTQFTTLNFSSGITLTNRGGNKVEIKAIYGSEVFNTGRTTTQTTSSSTFADYLAHSFTLAGGTYKIEYCLKITNNTASTNVGSQLLIDGVALDSGTNNLYRIVVASQRLTIGYFIVQALTSGAHNFRLQISTSAGTATAELGQIIITRIS